MNKNIKYSNSGCKGQRSYNAPKDEGTFFQTKFLVKYHKG